MSTPVPDLDKSQPPDASPCTICGRAYAGSITLNVIAPGAAASDPIELRIEHLCQDHLAERDRMGDQAFFNQYLRNRVLPGERCEGCGNPATQVLIRSRNILVDNTGRPVAEVEPRVAVCRPCWEGITGDRQDMPPPKIIHHLAQP